MNAPKQHDGGEDEASPTVRAARRALTLGEDVLYVAIAVLLVGGGLVVLAGAAGAFLDLGGTSVSSFALRLLDSLLLVFIFVELLAAVKLTLKRREIVAEPFLLVGIVASIKEIVVLSVEVADVMAGKVQVAASVTEFAVQIGVLGAVALALAVSAWLLRLKEREPEESS
jgi:uncharacterized membrane protein (DUF373 family)